jgi:hypothetical protein
VLVCLSQADVPGSRGTARTVIRRPPCPATAVI